MKISNYMNNANLIVEKTATKAKKEDSQTNEKSYDGIIHKAVYF